MWDGNGCGLVLWRFSNCRVCCECVGFDFVLFPRQVAIGLHVLGLGGFILQYCAVTEVVYALAIVYIEVGLLRLGLTV